MKPKGLQIGVTLLVPAMFLGLVLSVVLLLGGSRPASAGCGPAPSVSFSADTTVDGYSAEQLRNAAAIMNAGKALNLSANGPDGQRDGGPGGVGSAGAGYRRRRRPGLAGAVPAARQRRVGLLRGPHGPHQERHQLHQGPAGRGRLGAVGTDHCRQQGPAQRRPVPLPEVLARGRQTRSGALELEVLPAGQRLRHPGTVRRGG